MMPITERRVIAALSARANQVTGPDLRPAEPPTGHRRFPSARAMALVGAAAAVVVALATLAIVLATGRTDQKPAPPLRQPASVPAVGSTRSPEPAPPGSPTPAAPPLATPDRARTVTGIRPVTPPTPRRSAIVPPALSPSQG